MSLVQILKSTTALFIVSTITNSSIIHATPSPFPGLEDEFPRHSRSPSKDESQENKPASKSSLNPATDISVEDDIEKLSNLIPIEHRDEQTVLLISSAMKNLEDKIRKEIIHSISFYKEANRASLLHYTFLACYGTTDATSSDSYSDFLTTISNISPQDREEIMGLARSFFKDTDTVSDRASILFSIHRTKPDKRQNVLKNASQFIKYGPAGFIIELIGSVPSEIWEEKYFHLFMSFLKDQYDDACFNMSKEEESKSSLNQPDYVSPLQLYKWDLMDLISGGLKNIPLNNRAEAIRKVVFFITQLGNYSFEKSSYVTPLKAYQNLFEVCGEFSLQDIPALFDSAKPYLENAKHRYDWIDYLRFMNLIPLQDREEIVLSEMPRLIKDSGIFEVLKDISPTDRVPILQMIVPFIGKNCLPGLSYGDLLQLAHCVLPEQRLAGDDILTFISLLKGVKDSYIKSEIIRAVSQIHPNDRVNVAKLTQPYLIDTIRDWQLRNRFLKIISLLPSHSRDEHTIKLAINLVRNEEYLPDQVEVLPSHLRLEFLNRIDSFGYQRSGFINSFFDCPDLPLVKNEVHTYWKKTMEESPDKNLVRSMSQWILDHHMSLGFWQNHRITQLALRTQILLNHTQGKSNPYTFYNNMLKKRAEVIDLSKITPARELIEGYEVQINPAFLQKIMPRFIKFEELPPYDLNLLNRILSELTQRVEKDQKVQSYIKEITGLPFEELIKQSIENGGLLNLFAYKGANNEPVSLHQIRLIELIKYIESLSNKPDEDALLSEREEAFVRSLSEIQGCSTGIEGGIQAAYLYRTPSTSKASGLQGYQEGIIKVIRKEVEKMFSGNNEFAKSLCGMNPNDTSNEVAQASHQAKYLENMIGHEVGIKAEPSFDSHTQTLSQSLIMKTKEEILQAFYTYFKPSSIIQAIGAFADVDREDAIRLLEKEGILIVNKKPNK